MRILILTTDFLPNISGIATLSYEQAHGLQAMGHSIKVLTNTVGATHATTEGDFEVQEFTNHQLPIIRLTGLYKILNEVVADWKPDFIWCTNYRGFGLPVLAVARKHRVKYGIYIHGTEIYTENKTFIRRVIFKTVLKQAAPCCTNSENTARLLKTLHGLSAIPVTPGVHPVTEVLSESADEIAGFRKSWLDARPTTRQIDDRVVFIAVCRMSRQKGLYTVLESIALLDTALRERMLFIAVGSGEAALELEQLAAELLVSDYVLFAGPARRDQIPLIMKAGDVYLQPSQPVDDFLESFGISFMEAQAAGLPCIGTKWGGIPEAIQGPTTGILVPTGSTSAVAAAIARAITDTAWRAGAKTAGPAWALQNSWDNHIIKIESLLPTLKNSVYHAK